MLIWLLIQPKEFRRVEGKLFFLPCSCLQRKHTFLKPNDIQLWIPHHYTIHWLHTYLRSVYLVSSPHLSMEVWPLVGELLFAPEDSLFGLLHSTLCLWRLPCRSCWLLWDFQGATAGNLKDGGEGLRHLFSQLPSEGRPWAGCASRLQVPAPVRWSSPHSLSFLRVPGRLLPCPQA